MLERPQPIVKEDEAIHKTLRVTPAMAAGITDKLWEIGDIVALIEAKEAEKPLARSPYKSGGVRTFEV